MPVTYSHRLDQLVKERKFVPYRLNKHADYEVGKTYWSGYWQQWYKVLEIKPGPRSHDSIKIQWEYGTIVEHGTSLDTRRDYELRPFEFPFVLGSPVNGSGSYTAAEIKALCLIGTIDKIVSDDIKANYFENKQYKPNDYVYYDIYSGRDHSGIRTTILKRDLVKSPKEIKIIKNGGNINV